MANIKNESLAISSYLCVVMAKYNNTHISLIGREREYKILRKLLEEKESELVAMIGRRRVGKTFLIKKTYEKEIIFHLTGIQDASKAEQLENFIEARNQYFKKSINVEKPSSWIKAFSQLKAQLGKPKKEKRVLFFDELPWLAGNNNEFIKAFDHFWNSWAVDQNIVVVICGSAASWMITNIINNKGGLHNRVTKKIHLLPFTLEETEKYFVAKSIQMPRQSIVSIYLALGGIPYYLKEVNRSETAVQAINQICFGKDSPLYGEFNNLYKALFRNYEKHIEVIRVLAQKWKGLTRQEIIDNTSMNTGGGLTVILQELEQSDFIQSYIPYGKKQRDTLYRLIDEYSLFYLNFIEPNKNQSTYWIKKFNTQPAKIWAGYAFESLCIKNINGIKKALGISGIYTEESSFLKRKDKTSEGCQIDLLINRADNAINICEMKFYDGAYTLTQEELNKLKQKRNVFQETTKTKKQLFLTLITTSGLSKNEYAYEVDHVLEMDVLF